MHYCMSFKELLIYSYSTFMASADIKAFGHTYLLLLFGLAHFYTQGVFVKRISLFLLLASSSEVLYGHNLYLTSTYFLN